VTDRPTKSHEYVFLLSKRARYYYDAAAIAEAVVNPDWTFDQERRIQRVEATGGAISGGTGNGVSGGPTRNARTVWTIATQPFAEAHFATFPPALAERCIKAGSKVGDTVLDPFAGAGTTLLVAHRLNRDSIGIELNPAYADLARRRIHEDAPLFTGEEEHEAWMAEFKQREATK
jgi:DNA modification methylase